jgi:ABC-type multidrug transport system ATPase subunit
MGERPIAAEARDLVKEFDGKRAVDGVSLTVPEGSITGILGPNGAGKTTCLRMMLGIIDPSSGTRSLLATTGRSRLPTRSAICPRSGAFTRRCRRSRLWPSWARCVGCR